MASQSDDVIKLYAEIKTLSNKVDNLVVLVASQQKYINDLEGGIGQFRRSLERLLNLFRGFFGAI